jgi:hypothetical protein
MLNNKIKKKSHFEKLTKAKKKVIKRMSIKYEKRKKKWRVKLRKKNKFKNILNLKKKQKSKE